MSFEKFDADLNEYLEAYLSNERVRTFKRLKNRPEPGKHKDTCACTNATQYADQYLIKF